MEDGNTREPLVPGSAGGGRGGATGNQNNRNRTFVRCLSNAQDELKSFRSCLQWMCLAQSSAWATCMAWSIFVFFGLLVPIASHILMANSSCDSLHDLSFHGVVHMSLSSFATLSFVSLSRFVRKYGLRRFLFLDKLCDDSVTVKKVYTEQLNRSQKFLSFFVLPFLAAKSAYKIWWYASCSPRIPFLGIVYLGNIVACTMEIISWLYRTTIIFFVCVLFHLICSLQILRLQDFVQVFQVDSDVASILSEHLRIRRHLRIISHRYRVFILGSLILVTGS
ncbi:hypothetical protein SAY86_004529 [Trapa natans]|uniref:Uncharacterized protein n=1 Tax=Trapa natans TaxID=22666 RepID=A0AAN7MVE6_TRANT|nr:hypothetical protein SAY86_004529 [Trapa natans]